MIAANALTLTLSNSLSYSFTHDLWKPFMSIIRYDTFRALNNFTQSCPHSFSDMNNTFLLCYINQWPIRHSFSNSWIWFAIFIANVGFICKPQFTLWSFKKGKSPISFHCLKELPHWINVKNKKNNLLLIQNLNVRNLEMRINFIVLTEIGSDTHVTSTLGVRGRRGVRQKWHFFGRRRVGD